MSKPVAELKLSFKEYLIAIIELTEDAGEIGYIELEPNLLAKKITMVDFYGYWLVDVHNEDGTIDTYSFRNGDLEFIESK